MSHNSLGSARLGRGEQGMGRSELGELDFVGLPDG